MTRQRPSDALQLTQDAETACSSSGDVCRHGRISVQINAEVSNGADGRNVVGTDTERYTAGTWCMRRLDAHHITSVFAAFSCRRLLLIHAYMSSTQADTAFWKLAESSVCVSSAYRWTWRLCASTSRVRSAVYKRNKIGPRTEPWGTPQVTTDDLGQEPFSWTNWVRLLRYM